MGRLPGRGQYQLMLVFSVCSIDVIALMEPY